MFGIQGLTRNRLARIFAVAGVGLFVCSSINVCKNKNYGSCLEEDKREGGGGNDGDCLIFDKNKIEKGVEKIRAFYQEYKVPIGLSLLGAICIAESHKISVTEKIEINITGLE